MSRAFGEIPGFPEGAVFANRRHLADSEVHRPLQAGMCGSASDGGADSIVVSGGYEDDEDYGDEIVYTGHGGNDPATGRQIADQTLTRQNKALATNITSGLPVRVVRGANGDVAFSPSSGYRYDGLYRVQEYWIQEGLSGFQIVRFRLFKNVEVAGTPSVATTPEGQESPSRQRGTVLRIVRDTAVSRYVKELHQCRCQICGDPLETPVGLYAEAAHVRPLGSPHDGPDTPDNVLCLCPNHHVLFDTGAIHISDDLTVVWPGNPSSKLRTVQEHALDPTHFAHHRSRFGIK